jgi:hypothetical protein
MIPSRLESYLVGRNAQETPHGQSTLWAHLVGVYNILRKCSFSEDVCVAGLFHSVYGTQAFKLSIVDKNCRNEVKELIGEYAECLVWTFSILPRPKLLENSLKLQEFGWLSEHNMNFNEQQFGLDLIRLECANLLDQKCLFDFPYLDEQAKLMGMLN